MGRQIHVWKNVGIGSDWASLMPLGLAQPAFGKKVGEDESESQNTTSTACCSMRKAGSARVWACWLLGMGKSWLFFNQIPIDFWLIFQLKFRILIAFNIYWHGPSASSWAVGSRPDGLPNIDRREEPFQDAYHRSTNTLLLKAKSLVVDCCVTHIQIMIRLHDVGFLWDNARRNCCIKLHGITIVHVLQR